MEGCSLGAGSASDFVAREYEKLDLNDSRLNKRAKRILGRLQEKHGSCIRRVFIEAKEARQAYDFF